MAHAMQAIATLLVMCDARDLGVSVGENPGVRTRGQGPRTLGVRASRPQ